MEQFLSDKPFQELKETILKKTSTLETAIHINRNMWWH